MSRTLRGQAKKFRKRRVSNHRSRKQWSVANGGDRRLRTLDEECQRADR